jgi:serine/threonine-protein kinase
MDGDRRATPLLQTIFNERNAAISPNGRWLAYQSNESGQYEVYVRPFPDIEKGRWQVSVGGGVMPAWPGTERELFYVGADGALMSVAVTRSPSFAAGSPRMVVPAGFVVGPVTRSYDVWPDGMRFLMIDAIDTRDMPNRDMVVVLNWNQEIMRLLPP